MPSESVGAVFGSFAARPPDMRRDQARRIAAKESQRIVGDSRSAERVKKYWERSRIECEYSFLLF